MKLPDLPSWWCIVPTAAARRYIFTDYLSSVSKEWEDQVGRRHLGQMADRAWAPKAMKASPARSSNCPARSATSNWPTPTRTRLPFADVKNAAGNFITPSLESVTEALATAKIPDDFRFSMVNPPGEKAYPIAGATWLLVYEQQKDAAKGKKLVEFLNWALTKGERMAADAGLRAAAGKRATARPGTDQNH